MHNNSNSRRTSNVDDSFEILDAATQLDPPIPPLYFATPTEPQTRGEILNSLNRDIKDLSFTFDSLLFEDYNKQDFEKYKAIFYTSQALVLMMADHRNPPINPKKWTQNGRDSARLFALKANGTFPRTIDTISPNNVNPGVHCQSSVNDLRHLIPNMIEAFGENFQPVDAIYHDYHHVPVTFIFNMYIIYD